MQMLPVHNPKATPDTAIDRDDLATVNQLLRAQNVRLRREVMEWRRLADRLFQVRLKHFVKDADVDDWARVDDFLRLQKEKP